MTDVSSAAARAALDSRARVLAILSRHAGDLAAAEDALQGAFLSALESWPKTGVPDSPEAWLLTAAKRRLTDDHRKHAVRLKGEERITMMIDELAEAAQETGGLPDRRLELMMVCAHPALDEAIRPQMMLNVVLGIPAEDIARCWLTSPVAMAQRLVRAKSKIKGARIPFALPEPTERPTRIAFVLDAIYAALTLGAGDGDLAEEAAFLASLVHKLAPDDPEAGGLLALCLQHTATRQEPGEDFLPWRERDPGNWDHRLLAVSEALLGRASQRRRPGRFQLEAAIGSAHLARVRDGMDTRFDIIRLYKRLLAVAPSIGARCSYAAALLETGDIQGASTALGGLEDAAESYQPYWVIKARILKTEGREAEAKAARDRALALTSEERVARFLRES